MAQLEWKRDRDRHMSMVENHRLKEGGGKSRSQSETTTTATTEKRD